MWARNAPIMLPTSPARFLWTANSQRAAQDYEAVLEAQNAAIAAAKPGMKLLGDGEDWLNGIAKARVAKRGLDQYYLHALGHHVGLEVHDPADPDVTLKPGMVFTIEPGIYVAGEKMAFALKTLS